MRYAMNGVTEAYNYIKKTEWCNRKEGVRLSTYPTMYFAIYVSRILSTILFSLKIEFQFLRMRCIVQ